MLYSVLTLLAATTLAHAGTVDEKLGPTDDKLSYSTVVDISAASNPYVGKTYFNMMKSTVKPALDTYTMKGFNVRDGSAMDKALLVVGGKVSSGAASSGGGKAGFENIATALSSKPAISFYDLPTTLRSTPGFTGNMFDATTYLALFSSGGVAIKYAPATYSYNVNYGTGKAWPGEPIRYATMGPMTLGKKTSIHTADVQTGRSYGAGPGQRTIDRGSTGADDVSDKDYLTELANFVRAPNSDASEFYRSLLMTIANTDTSNFAKMSDSAKTLAADFLAVYTAEEDRHLMNWPSHNWDSALLDVTLLSAFYANPSDVNQNNPMWIMFTQDGKKTVFTKTVSDQYPDSSGKLVARDARFYDYWQRSRQPKLDPKTGLPMRDVKGNIIQSTRSGINITRSQFSALGNEITAFERAKNPAVVKKAEVAMGSTGKNLFDELSKKLIDSQPTSIANANAMVDAFVEFLAQVTADAPAISEAIQQDQNYESAGIDFTKAPN